MPSHFIPGPLLHFFSPYRLSGPNRGPKLGKAHALNDYMLKDVGLTRSDVEVPGRKW